MSQKNSRSKFFINWILKDELAIGPAPRREDHLIQLEEKNIKGILSLCGIEEVPPPKNMNDKFFCKRIVLPDHTYNRNMNINELNESLELLEELKKEGAIFVHCKAAIERSPLICMAWLIKTQSLTIKQSLNYLMTVNKGTCPMQDQLNLLKELF